MQGREVSSARIFTFPQLFTYLLLKDAERRRGLENGRGSWMYSPNQQMSYDILNEISSNKTSTFCPLACFRQRGGLEGFEMSSNKQQIFYNMSNEIS